MPKRIGNGLDLLLQRIQNVGDAVSPADAVTLQQLQSFVRGLSWKTAARAASTTNVSLTAPGVSMDGVALVSGDRVLLKNQTAGAENGIYVWTGSAATLTRSPDASTASQLSGAAVTVTEGTTNLDKTFTQNADAITVGTTTLSWVLLGGAAAAYLAGAGLSLTGQTFAVVAGLGIISDATSVRVDTSVIARKVSLNIAAGTTANYLHNLNTRDVQVTVYDTVAFDEVLPDVIHVDLNNVTITFGAAVTAGAYRVVIQG